MTAGAVDVDLGVEAGLLREARDDRAEAAILEAKGGHGGIVDLDLRVVEVGPGTTDLFDIAEEPAEQIELVEEALPPLPETPLLTLEQYVAKAAEPPVIEFDRAGNGIAVWTQASDVYARHYTNSAWGAQITLDSGRIVDSECLSKA